MDTTALCRPLLAQCIDIIGTLGTVREHLIPVPVTLTSLATECFLMHQAILKVHRGILISDGTSDDGERDLLQTLNALLLGCKITISAINETTSELSQTMSTISSLDSDELSTADRLALRKIWNDERMDQFRLQLITYRTSLPNSITRDSIDNVGSDEPPTQDVDSMIVIGNSNHPRISFHARPSSRNSSNQGSILDPSPPYALSLHEETRGYVYLGPANSEPQTSFLDDFRHVRPDHDVGLPDFTTIRPDAIDLPGATPEKLQNPLEIKLQAVDRIADKSLLSAGTASSHSWPGKNLAGKPPQPIFSTDFKVVVMGASGTGKDTFTAQFVQSRFMGEFEFGYDPTIYDDYRRSIIVDDTPALVEVLDTTGTEQFTAMQELYAKMTDGFVFLYSITSEESFVEIQTIYDGIARIKQSIAWPRVLVANHFDRVSERVVSTQAGEKLAERLGCAFFEVSSRNGHNVDNAFRVLVRNMRFDRASRSPIGKSRDGKDGKTVSGAHRRRQRDQGRKLGKVDEEDDVIEQRGEKSETKGVTKYFKRRSKERGQ